MKNTYFKLTEDLTLQKVSNMGKIARLSLLLNLALIIFIGVLTSQEPIIHRIHTHTRDTVRIGDIYPNDSSVLSELIKNDCVLPSVAVAQAKIESGNYKSVVCKSNKNLFGIKYHKCNYVLGKNLNHASYKSYKDNIKCYIDIQNRYLRNIDGKYAEAGGYVDIIKAMKR